jgi:methylglutaconyl-CoA hydratase
MNSYKTLLVTNPQENILRIDLNRPDLHNAFNDELIKELTQLGKKISNQLDIRVIILSGQGRSFCAGADLNWMKKTHSYTIEENFTDSLQLGQLFKVLHELPQAVIGRINGSAIGGGTGLVSICDICVGIERAKFGFSEVNLGIIPAVISPFVVEKIGFQHAREYFITGQRFSALRAQEIGLLNYVVPDEKTLDKKIQELIQEILTSGPRAVQHSKILLNKLLNYPETIHEYTARTIANLRVSPEGQEGITSFLEKRKPSWNQKVEEK